MIPKDFFVFFYFMIITIFTWVVRYLDFDQIMVCYGCNEILPSYDYIIVGCGTSGSIIARRLAENATTKILVLEAGGKGNAILSIPSIALLLQQSKFDWNYRTTPQKGACLALNGQKSIWPMGKVIGGTHMLNNLIYTRGHQKDYEIWFENKTDFSYETDVEIFFNRSEKIFTDIPETINNTQGSAILQEGVYVSAMSDLILESFMKLGFIIGNATKHYFGGFYKPLVTIKDSRRWTTADHLMELEQPNVQLLSKAIAERIIFKDDFEARGVKFQYLGTTYWVGAKKGVIVTAGVIGSPKLLMLSGVGPKKHLKNVRINVTHDLPVGENLQDHVTTGFDLILINTTSVSGLKFEDMMSPSSAYEYFWNSQGPWTSTGCELIGFTTVDYIQCKANFQNSEEKCRKYLVRRPDLQFMVVPTGLTSDSGVHLKNLIGINDYTWDNYFELIDNKTVTILPVLLHPLSRGTVQLKNKNPTSSPIIDPKYLSHPQDIKVLIKSLFLIQRLVDKKPLRMMNVTLNKRPFPGCEKHVFGSYCYWNCYIKHLTITAYHPVGTCRMGSNKTNSVVDYDFRVHGTNKLYVADASVFPTTLSGNINAAVMMMAERAADLIQRDWIFISSYSEAKKPPIP